MCRNSCFDSFICDFTRWLFLMGGLQTLQNSHAISPNGSSIFWNDEKGQHHFRYCFWYSSWSGGPNRSQEVLSQGWWPHPRVKIIRYRNPWWCGSPQRDYYLPRYSLMILNALFKISRHYYNNIHQSKRASWPFRCPNNTLERRPRGIFPTSISNQDRLLVAR